MAVGRTHVSCRAVGRNWLMVRLFPLVIALAAAFTPAAAFADVTLGVLIPLTGPGSGYGQQMRTAIEMFSEKYLDLGGKAGKLKLDVQDTRGNVPEAINLTRKLIRFSRTDRRRSAPRPSGNRASGAKFLSCGSQCLFLAQSRHVEHVTSQVLKHVERSVDAFKIRK